MRTSFDLTPLYRASVGFDPAPFRDVATNLDEIAQAWRQVSGG